MRVQLRETGSILVKADQDEVIDLLERVVGGARVGPDRLEATGGGTYVVRAAEGGTHVIHARKGEAGVARATREREELRSAVASDLFALQRLFQVK